MAGIQELKRFRENILMNMSKKEKEEKIKNFSSEKEVIKIDIEKMYSDLDVLRGR